jgi:nitroimidazol reductase NimA-like FMN-containing flavoprotein (pyridoxamine 5'-phosphate oxidase superfamily)
MKIVNAIPEMGGLSKAEIDSFLENKLNVQLATVDEMGEPNIQPVWFYYDKNANELHVVTNKMGKKVRNLRSKPIVYFSIDDENFPYKGVKGKGTTTILEDAERITPIAEKINMKYLGTLDHPIAKMILENAKNGTEVALKIKPKFFSTWDFGKAQ